MKINSEEMKKGIEPSIAWFKKREKEFVDMVTQFENGIHITKSKLLKTYHQ